MFFLVFFLSRSVFRGLFVCALLRRVLGFGAMADSGDDMEGGEVSSGLHCYWPTVDGPLGVYHEEAVKYAKWFFYVGFLCLPWVWFINCFYFWPVLRNSRSDPLIRPYVVKSGIGFLVFGSALLAWALTFAYGGERLFGSSWEQLAVYDIADKYGQIIS